MPRRRPDGPRLRPAPRHAEGLPLLLARRLRAAFDLLGARPLPRGLAGLLLLARDLGGRFLQAEGARAMAQVQLSDMKRLRQQLALRRVGDVPRPARALFRASHRDAPMRPSRVADVPRALLARDLASRTPSTRSRAPRGPRRSLPHRKRPPRLAGARHYSRAARTARTSTAWAASRVVLAASAASAGSSAETRPAAPDASWG